MTLIKLTCTVYKKCRHKLPSALTFSTAKNNNLASPSAILLDTSSLPFLPEMREFEVVASCKRFVKKPPPAAEDAREILLFQGGLACILFQYITYIQHVFA